MADPKLLYDYLKSDEEYNKLFDEKVKTEMDWWEADSNHKAIYPAEEDLANMRVVAEAGQKNRRRLFDLDRYYRRLLYFGKAKDIAWADVHKHLRKEAERILWERPRAITEEYIKDLHERTLLGFGVISSMAIKDLFETGRKETTQKWKKEAEVKNKKILGVMPFENVKCKNCRGGMQYQWSQLINKPNDPKGEEMVLFFYDCPNKCGKQAIFEDGTPWISESKNNCVICGGNRSSTVTKDNAGTIYIIFECKKCGSREVEKVER